MRGAAVVALLAMTVACTGPETTAITEPLAPPDTFAPTTTATTERRTTTTVDIERAAIYRVDPHTLEPITGFDPIPVGDWAWGASSKNGSWLAVSLGHENQSQSEIHLIDVDGWQTAAIWTPAIDSVAHVSDEGTIYVINGGWSSYHLSRLVPGEIRPQLIADLPTSLYWYQLHIHDKVASIFGLNSPEGDNKGEAVIVTVDLESGAVTEIPLPEVEMGTIGELELAEYGPTPFDAYPVVVWDDDNSRVLIVDVNRDVITELDPRTGDLDVHQFGLDRLNSTPTTDQPFAIGLRSASLGRPNGGVLYVATAIQTFEVVDEYLTVTSIPEGIEAIDTNTWEVINLLDAPVSDISLSSAGDRLLASGQAYSDSGGAYESESSGVYLIDAVDLEVIAHHGGDEMNQYYGVSFHPGLRIGYIQSWDQLTNIGVMNLETGRIVATRTGSDIQFYPEAEVLIESVQG